MPLLGHSCATCVTTRQVIERENAAKAALLQDKEAAADDMRAQMEAAAASAKEARAQQVHRHLPPAQVTKGTLSPC